MIIFNRIHLEIKPSEWKAFNSIKRRQMAEMLVLYYGVSQKDIDKLDKELK